MSSVPGVPVLRNKKAVSVLIEQAIARQEPTSRIMRALAVDYERVRDVRDSMNRACADTLSRYNYAALIAEGRSVAAARQRADWAAQVALSHAMRGLESALQELLRPEAMSA